MPTTDMPRDRVDNTELSRRDDAPLVDWVRPDFQDFATAPEVTAYAGMR